MPPHSITRCTYYIREAFFERGDPTRYQSVIGPAFSFVVAMAYCEAHSMIVATIMSHSTTDMGTQSHLSKLVNFFSKRPRLLTFLANYALPSTAMAFLFITIVLFSLAAVKVNDASNMLVNILTSLGILEASWSPEIGIREIPAGIQHSLVEFAEAANHASHCIGRSFLVHSINLGVLLLLYM